MNILISSIMDVRKTAPNRLHHFVKHLARNHRVTILSTNQWWKAEQSDLGRYDGDFERLLAGADIRYLTEGKSGALAQEALAFTRTARLLGEAGWRDADVHLNYSALLGGYRASKLLLKAGIGSVYDIADDLPKMTRTSPAIPGPLRWPAGLLSAMITRRNIRLADKVTYTVKGLIEGYGLPGDRTELISNGVDTEIFRYCEPSALRNELGLGTGFVVGYLGGLREWIDLEPAYAAVKRLREQVPDMKLLVVGEEGDLKGNRDLAATYGLGGSAVFPGTVGFSQVPRYISCMDVCLIPFRTNAVAQNALPLKLFEYLACERPVISTRIRGVIEAAGDRVLYASDADELAARIRELYDAPDRRRERGEAGREFVLGGYSWEHLGARMEQVLAGVAAARGRRTG
jgi:glycosyltransferase involved in cell wall biosynthesis